LNRKQYRSLFSFAFAGFVLSVLPFIASRAVAQPNPDGAHIDRLWDETLVAAEKSKRNAIIFDVDYVDTLSIAFKNNVLSDRRVQQFIRDSFEVGIVDFSVDPPPEVGFDSLRNLGNRLDGFERRYEIVIRPTVMLLRPDGSEIDRIPFANKYTPETFIERVKEILQGRNTLESYRQLFLADTTSLVNRFALINQYEERSKYDSVLRQLEVVMNMKDHPDIAREAGLRYSYMRLQVEHNPEPLKSFITTLGHTGEDSLVLYNNYADLLEFYKGAKKLDSAAIYYEKIMELTGKRDPDLLNEYAWNLANYTKRWDKALALINEAIQLKPNDPNFFDTRAFIQFVRKERSAAVKDAERALELTPKDSSDDQKYFEERLKYYRDHEHDKDPEPENYDEDDTSSKSKAGKTKADRTKTEKAKSENSKAKNSAPGKSK